MTSHSNTDSTASSNSTPEATDVEPQQKMHNHPASGVMGLAVKECPPADTDLNPAATSQVESASQNNNSSVQDIDKWLEDTTQPVWKLLSLLSQCGVEDEAAWAQTADQVIAVLQPLKERWHRLENTRKSLQGAVEKRPVRRGRRGRPRAN